MNSAIGAFIWAIVIAIFIGLFGGVWFAYKQVQVWSASMNGQAVLAEAEYSRKVRIQEAISKKEAATLEGEAELTRAQFASRANRELAEGLGGHEGYLRYLYIRMLEEQGGEGKQIIYIPTEAGMPLLEAGKRQ